MDTTPSLVNESNGLATNVARAPDIQTNSLPVAIPWGAYCVTYFIQAAIMAMILMNVPVFLRQGLALDWLAISASYIMMFVPVLLRPLLAWAADRRPSFIATFILLGVTLVIAGSVGASIGAFSGPNGIVPTSAGFSIAVVGATLMNVAADSHIVRAVPLDRSARVNSFRRIFAFLGIATGQICYLLFVGSHYTDFARWTAYFAVPAVIAGVGYGIAVIARKGWRILPPVEGLPPLRAPWLAIAAKKGEIGHEKPIILGAVLAIAFLFTVPEGLLETTFENFIITMYGDSAWITYSSILMVGGAIGVIGYLLAARSSSRTPEWDFLWYFPVAAAYYAFLWIIPPFQGLLWVTIAFQVPATFVQVRLFQSWQAHSYSHRPALLFQVFITTFQVGKIVGLAITGFIMKIAGYTGILSGVVVLWLVTTGVAFASYFFIAKK